MNSIRDNLSKGEIISEIRLSLTHEIMRNYIFIVVEGKDDIKFWKKFISDNVILFESFSGKEGIKEIVIDFFKNNKRILGIRDKDYDNSAEEGNILCYDSCCLEIMLADNDNTFKKIFDEYYFGPLNALEFKELLLRQLKFISLVRKYSTEDCMNLKLNGISINNAFNLSKKEIDNNMIIEQINRHNANYFTLNEDKLEKIKSKHCKEVSCKKLLEITQGHDFLITFAIYSNIYFSKHIKDSDISASLRCSYQENSLIETNIYSKIKKYENENNLEKILIC
ncbi:hypothetical protein CLPUN_39180 [Clostridium puniceum]|uniref:Uncharacterized protein n=1 Tax=Clostridium puniceum TaxID=29367 RepID=A0A1S8TAK8_9CLOT|nr:DUF4435 domain-containing protein [Clostridium puniceum]OOM74465.1 hypothetical protein CLPUN_39180 [Clostridium puniceum]